MSFSFLDIEFLFSPTFGFRIDTPWGEKNQYAARSPYGDSVLRRFARKYRESLKKGTIAGQVIGAFELKNKTKVCKPNARVKFPDAEEKLFNKFKELRQVGIKVDGNFLKYLLLVGILVCSVLGT